MNSSQIAKLAGVSRSTVSRVLNDYDNVPDETRKKIQAIIDEHGYTPNHSARTLAGKSNNIIGVFLADLDEGTRLYKWSGVNAPYNSELLANIISELKERGYLTLTYVITKEEEYKNLSQYFDNRLIHGGIFVGFPYKTQIIEDFSKQDYNTAFIDLFDTEDDIADKINIINCDNIYGGYEATKHLINHGHTKIAHISGDDRLSSIHREKGFRQAMTENKLDDNLVIKGSYHEETAYQETIKLFENHKPTAIFAGNDIMALGVIRALSELGLHVPSDVSVIGFDNIEVAEWASLKLTTFGVNKNDLVKYAVQSLFENKTNHYVCIPKIIERESVELKRK